MRDSTKYRCRKVGDWWYVRRPSEDGWAWHQAFPTFHEAILHIRAHLRMDALGVPRG